MEPARQSERARQARVGRDNQYGASESQVTSTAFPILDDSTVLLGLCGRYRTIYEPTRRSFSHTHFSGRSTLRLQIQAIGGPVIRYALRATASLFSTLFVNPTKSPQQAFFYIGSILPGEMRVGPKPQPLTRFRRGPNDSTQREAGEAHCEDRQTLGAPAAVFGGSSIPK